MPSPLRVEPRRLHQRAIDADVAQVDVQAADVGRAERRQQQFEDLAVGGDAGVAVELGADLHDLPRVAGARRLRAQHAPRVAEARDAGLVQQVRVDARDLRRRVGAHAEHAARQRIDGLERLQVEVASGAGQQRIEELDQRRLHQPVAAHAEVIEQHAAQRLDARRFRGQHVLDRLRAAATYALRSNSEADRAERDRDQADEPQLPVGELDELAERLAPHPRRGERQDAFEDQQHGEGRPE